MGNLSNPDAYSGIVKGLGGGGGSVDFPTDITNPQDGQLLQYDATSEKWINVDNEPCVVTIVPSTEIKTATSEDYDNYKYDKEGNPIQIGSSYKITSFGVSINDFDSNKVFRYNENAVENNGSCVYDYINTIGYQYEDDIYVVGLSSSIGTTTVFYVINKNLEIKLFELYTGPSE